MIPLNIASTTTKEIEPSMRLVIFWMEVPRLFTTGAASAKVTLRAGNARARDGSIPILAQIKGYKNNEATAIANVGKMIAMYCT